ncbi:hypothetical protein ACTXT7_011485 [Hymenolepis weldensis]
MNKKITVEVVTTVISAAARNLGIVPLNSSSEDFNAPVASDPAVFYAKVNQRTSAPQLCLFT